MKFYSNLIFDGNCREALDYYSSIFEKEPQTMTFGQAPPNSGFPDMKGMEDKILHAEIRITEHFTLMMSDTMPHFPYKPGNNYTIAIFSEDLHEIQRMYEKFKDHSEIIMELQKTFWSPAYAQLIDRFGVYWMFNCQMM